MAYLTCNFRQQPSGQNLPLKNLAMENAAPDVRSKERVCVSAFEDRVTYAEWLTGRVRQDVTTEEVYELVKGLNDPEYPLTLQELAVVTRDQIEQIKPNRFALDFTPTVPHCSQANIIGLSLKAALQNSIPPNCHVSVSVKPHTHNSATTITKQINDKERVCAALENPAVRAHVRKALTGSRRMDEVIATSLVNSSSSGVTKAENEDEYIHQLADLIAF